MVTNPFDWCHYAGMTGNWRKSSHSTHNGACVEAASWRKSTYSFSNGNCVEIGQGDAVVGVRDTADRSGPMLTFSAEAWQAFTAVLKAR